MAKGKWATTLCALLSAISEVSFFIVSSPKACLSQGEENVQLKYQSREKSNRYAPVRRVSRNPREPKNIFQPGRAIVL